MPSKANAYDKVESIISETLAVLGTDVENAWLGIYASLLWYEPIGGGRLVPHIIDADKLWKPDQKRKGTYDRLTVWANRALTIEQALAKAFHCGPTEVQQRVDRLMKDPMYDGLQRQNPLGAGFIGGVIAVMRKFGRTGLTYYPEMSATKLFPGISMPGRSQDPSIDIVITRKEELVAIISCKWSVRHDRIGDVTTECSAYRNAFEELSRKKLLYYVVSNEYDPGRLAKLLDDTCINNVVHVHKALITDVLGFNSRLSGLWDLKDLISATTDWA